MTMNSYVIDDHLRGVEFHCKIVADQIGLKKLLEYQTGLSFSTYLSDRKAAWRLKMAVMDWISENCQVYLDDFPYKEAGLARDHVLKDVATRIYWSLVCQEYGKNRANAILNRVLQDF